MDTTDTSPAEHHHQQPHLPPGFRFHPTDEELVVHYLMRRAQSAPLPISIIAELDLYKFDPWELPDKAVFGEQEWYFFSPRDRKYPNGARPNRAATSGYWKATGTDKPIFSAGNKKVGVKKALVFYGGKPPRGHKTNWIMHEYRMADNNNNKKPLVYGYNSNNKKGSLRLDDWVLCRIYKKNNRHKGTDHEREESMEDMMMMGSMAIPNSINSNTKPSLSYMNPSHEDGQGICFEGMMNIGNQQEMQLDPSISMVSSLATDMPLKRALPPLYWPGGGSANKRVLGLTQDDNDDYNSNNNNNNNNIGDVLHQQTLLGPLSEGVFRQVYQVHGFNWYS